MNAVMPRNLDLELAYPSGLYQCIFYTALFLHPIHIYAGFYYEMNEGGLMGVALCATSLNYWRFPDMRSYRRTIDMVVAKTTIAHHLYLSFYTANRLYTTLPFLLGIGFYLLSLRLYANKHVKTAALCHCLLHTVVGAAATSLYKDYYHSRHT